MPVVGLVGPDAPGDSSSAGAGTVGVPGAGGAAVPAAFGSAAPSTGTPTPPTDDFTSALPDERAAIAVRTALAQRGLPYVWGGDGPGAGEVGFDCSGLTTFSYRAAGIALPRTAHTQYYAGPHVPAGAPLQPGDLVFYGTAAKVHHVGMYIGAGRMVNAPTFGKPVQVSYYRWSGDDYLGSTRPAANGETFEGTLPVVPADPAPRPPADPNVFPAPVAPLPSVLPRAIDPQPPEPQTAEEARRGQRPASTPGTTASPPTVSTSTPGSTSPGVAPGAGPAPPAVSRPVTVSPSPPLLQAPTTTRTAPSTNRPGPTTGPTSQTPSPSSPSPSSPSPASPNPSSPTPAPASPGRITAIGWPDGTVLDLAVVRRSSDGLPARPGTVSSAGRVILRVNSSDLVDGLDAGTRLRASYSDGSTRTFTVGTRVSVPTGADAARAAGEAALVLVTPDGAGGWIVLIAS